MKLHLMPTNQARDSILVAANLDWIEFDYKEESLYLGDNLKNFFRAESDRISIDEFYEFLDSDGKKMAEKYRSLLRNGVLDHILLHISENMFPNADIEITITEVVENESEHYSHGYGRIVRHNNYGLFKSKPAGKKDEKADTTKRDMAFLSDMGHELRTPLNSIVGFSRLSADEEDPGVRKEYLQIIEENNETLLQLINDILDLSKIESGTLDFHMATFSINHLINDLALGAQLRLSEDVELKVSLPEHDYEMNSDKRRIQQIINNFINNAIKFTKQGSITVGLERREDKYYIYVKDTGTGIPQDKLSAIFKRFVRLNNQVAGNGLGLSICNSITEKLGGKIGVESKVGEGSNFWILLPDSEAHTAKAHEDSIEDSNKQHDRLNGIKILIAEDDPSNYKLCEVILKRKYELIHAWNGEEAVDLFKKEKPDVVIMDINMPKMNGYDATSKIREVSWTVPIIALTAYALADDEEKIMQSGFDAYLSKPLDNSKLDEYLNKLVK